MSLPHHLRSAILPFRRLLFARARVELRGRARLLRSQALARVISSWFPPSISDILLPRYVYKQKKAAAGRSRVGNLGTANFSRRASEAAVEEKTPGLSYR